MERFRLNASSALFAPEPIVLIRQEVFYGPEKKRPEFSARRIRSIDARTCEQSPEKLLRKFPRSVFIPTLAS